MANTGRDEVVWAELQRQVDVKGLRIKRGIMQETTFIRLILDHRRKRFTEMLRLAVVEMGIGQRKERKLFLLKA